MTCCHFFCSAVFSMPVWRKPIVGEADTTVSPSSSSTSRSTPWVLGCCGPMLTVMVSVRTSATSTSRQPIFHHVRAKLLFGHLQRLGRGGRLPNLHGVVLPQRIALPIFWHKQAAGIGMPVEGNPEEIPDLALEPVGGRPDRADGGDMCVGAVQPDLQADAPVARDGHDDVHQLEPGFSRPIVGGR